jgi:hypothetical protein
MVSRNGKERKLEQYFVSKCLLYLSVGAVSPWLVELIQNKWVEQTHISSHLLHPANLWKL